MKRIICSLAFLLAVTAFLLSIPTCSAAGSTGPDKQNQYRIGFTVPGDTFPRGLPYDILKLPEVRSNDPGMRFEDPEGDAVQVRIFNGFAAGDYYGQSVSSAGDVNGDGFDDIIVGAYEASSYTGKAYIYFGGNIINTVADVIMTGEAPYSRFGHCVSSAGDVNGDGYDDVIVGAFSHNGFTGRAFIFFGGSSMDNVADISMTGEGSYNFFGFSVASAGDVNGDGYCDAMIGATGYGASAGKVYIYFGGLSMDNVEDVTITGETYNNNFGVSVSHADFNIDGFSDIVVGGSQYLSYTGRVYVYYGDDSMNTDADLIINGEAVGDYFGYSVSSTGDVNGDGFGDIAVGAYDHAASTGRVYVYYGGSILNNVADLTFDGESPGDRFGQILSIAGDVNGDGYSDLIVGAGYHNIDVGKAYLYFGGANMNNIADLYLDGETSGSYFGASLSGAGDVNGDGYADILVGALGYNSNTGRVYLYDYTDIFTSCGPGPHFVDNCSAGTDSLDIAHSCETKAVIRMTLDTSDNCNVPSVLLPPFTGSTIVRRSAPKDTSGRFPGVAQLDGHMDIIETEFSGMELRTFVASGGDTAFLKITAGAGRGTGPCGTALRATYGYIHELPAYNNAAESFFDVFLELCIEDPYGLIGPPNPRYYLYNTSPVRMGATIDQIPPKCGRDPLTQEYYTVYRPDPNTCVKLYASCIPGPNNPPLAKVVHVEHALPVELKSFTSAVTGNDVTLNWITSSENNNRGFSIEREFNNNWLTVGFVAGKGAGSSYEFTDRDLPSGRYSFRLKQTDFNGSCNFFNLNEEVVIGIPSKFSLSQNYPNPFNPVTRISYDIPEAMNVSLRIFDNLGRELKTLVDEFREAGYYTEEFNADGLSSGIYYYRLEAGSYVAAKKMAVIK